MARALTIAAARCVVFTGGGTAGHVFPGLAVAAELARRWDGRIVWIGSRKGPERALVEAAGLPFRSIPAGKLRRYRSLENVTDVFRIVGGLAASLAALAAERPSLPQSLSRDMPHPVHLPRPRERRARRKPARRAVFRR